MRAHGRDHARVDGVQRGAHRDGPDDAPAALAGLPGPLAGPVVARVVAGTATSVTFYVDLGDPSNRVRQRDAKRPASSAASRSRAALIAPHSGRRAGRHAVDPTYSYANYPLTPTDARAAPTSSRPRRTTRRAGAAGFRFYALNTATPPKPDGRDRCRRRRALTTPTSRRAVARIEITFRANRTRGKATDRGSTLLINEVYVRTADPNAPTPRPTCHDRDCDPPLRAERGFSMFLVVVAMLLTSMFVAAGFAAANGDLPISGVSKNRKVALRRRRGRPGLLPQAAAAGPRTTGPSAISRRRRTPSEANPINQQWDGAGADTRKWRKLPSVAAEYTIELLHTPKSTASATDPTSRSRWSTSSNGTFKVRVTGRTDRRRQAAKRSIIATFKRNGFLNFVYFTDQENRDPQA